MTWLLEGRWVFQEPSLVWLCLVALVVVVPPIFFAKARVRLGSSVLRALAIVLVACGAAGLSIESSGESEPICVVVVTDVSESARDAAIPLANELVSGLRGELGPSDLLAGVAFGVEAVTVSEPAPPSARLRFRPEDASGAESDLGSGVETATALCPTNADRRIVVVSDGNDTSGNVPRAIEAARRTGAVVSTVAARTKGGASFAVVKTTAPPLVREGSVFPLRLVVRSFTADPQPVDVEIHSDGELVLRRSVALSPGLNAFEVPHEIHARGVHRLGAHVVRAEEVDGREIAISVAGPLSVVVVSERRDPPIARALEGRGVDVGVIEPAELSENGSLEEAHSVILDDLPRRTLPASGEVAIERYVRELGGGLVMIGGARSFGDRRYDRSPIERALPVDFVPQDPPPKDRRPMGVFLLVDRSNSMGYSSHSKSLRDAEKMAYAKQAARALLEQLRDDDRVGVVAFDSDPWVLGELRALAEQRKKLEDRIVRLLPGGGTDFKEALEIAAAQLAGSNLTVRHVILLTDGDTNRSASDHETLIASIAKVGISVTTIRIGLDDVNLEFLRDISSRTGGRFYHVRDLEQLPQLLVRDAREAEERDRRQASSEKTAPRPTWARKSVLARGLERRPFPSIGRGVRSLVKPGADLLAELDREGERLPFLVAWQYGLGRAVALLLDPEDPHAGDWIRWDGYPKLVSQLVRWTVREDAPWETRLAVRAEGGRLLLEVQNRAANAGEDLIARLVSIDEPNRDGFEVSLAPYEHFAYRAELPAIEPGRYSIVLTRRSGEEILSTHRETVTVSFDDGPPISRGELSRRAPDLDLLQRLASETGGAVGATVAELTGNRGEGPPRRSSFVAALLLLAIGLVLGDVALRERLS